MMLLCRFHQLQVIGDKMGGPSSAMTSEKYESTYKTLTELLGGVPISIVTVVRNPYDVISTMALYSQFELEWKVKLLATGKISKTNKAHIKAKLLDSTIKNFFRCADKVKRYCITDGNGGGGGVGSTTTESSCIIVHNIDLVQDTRETVKKLCAFLGVECYEFYLQQCQEKVFSELSKSRKLVKWSQEQINEVERKMKDYHFLDRYSFHGDE